MVYLDIAQYLLSGDPTWLNVVIANIDHHSSQLRFSLHAPLGLIASDMKLGHPELLSRMESNLRKSHFFNDSLMCLFCVLQGEPVVKLAQLMRWRQQIDLAPQDVKTLDTLIAGEPISNAAIFGEYSRITRYLVCRLLDPEIAAPSHLTRGIGGCVNIGSGSHIQSATRGAAVWDCVSRAPRLAARRFFCTMRGCRLSSRLRRTLFPSPSLTISGLELLNLRSATTLTRTQFP
jgi:hypothetical protein